MIDLTNAKGLRLTVYRPADPERRSESNILTDKAETLTLVGTVMTGQPIQPLSRESQVFTPDADAPPVVLVQSSADAYGYGPHLEPLSTALDGTYTMAGANYAGTSDSRWCALGRDVFGHDKLDIVSVHDWVEP